MSKKSVIILMYHHHKLWDHFYVSHDTYHISYFQEVIKYRHLSVNKVTASRAVVLKRLKEIGINHSMEPFLLPNTVFML
jgi:hypothetical protein